MRLIDNKLLLFGGKGGVGKTVCAAATALYAASQEKKVLVLSTDPAHSLSDSFGVKIGDKITRVRTNLDALEFDAASLLVEYKKKYGELIKQIAEEGTFFSKEEIKEFFDLSLPGIDELMALIKVIEILEEDNYDLLILDTAPTGHTIRLLEMPEVMTAYIKVLAEMRQKHRVVVSMMTRRKYIKDEADKFIDKMHSDVEKVKAMLKDTGKTKFVLVTIPEAMGVLETERLAEVLRKHDIPVGGVLINRVVEGDCGFCQTRRKGQEKYLQEIKEKFKKYKIREIPLFAQEIKGKSLESLAKIIFEGKKQFPQLEVKKIAGPKFDLLKIKQGLKFLLFGGKGGVGKTSCAAAVALEEAKKRKVLIFSTDPAHSLSDSFGVRIGDKITKVKENLDALEIDAYVLLDNLKKQYKKEITEFFRSAFKPTTTATIDAPYDRRVMEDLFDLCPPGIDEIMALKTMMELMKEGKYELFILDTAPTGHTIRLLEMPEMAEEWLNTLLDIEEKYPLSLEIGDTLREMLETIKKVREILINPEKTEFIVVAIPEKMSLLETEDLVGSLRKLKVPAEQLIVNKIVPDSDCGFCSVKRNEQLGYAKELEKLKLKLVGVELFSQEVKGEDLSKLRESLFRK